MPIAFSSLTHQVIPRVLLALSAWGGVWAGAWAQKVPTHSAADLILKNGQIHTLAEHDTVHQALAIRDGRIRSEEHTSELQSH